MSIIDFITDARSVLTLVSLLTFLGIVWWAYAGSRKPAFSEAARLPFADDEDAQAAPAGATSMEKRNG